MQSFNLIDENKTVYASVNDINRTLQTLLSCSSGSTPPPTSLNNLTPGQLFLNETENKLYQMKFGNVDDWHLIADLNKTIVDKEFVVAELKKKSNTTHNHDTRYLAIADPSVDSRMLGGKSPSSYLLTRDINHAFATTSKTTVPSSYVFNLLYERFDNLSKALGENPDEAMKHLQEMLKYVEANVATLSSLSVSNVAGLEAALATKLPKTTKVTDIGGVSKIDGVFTDSVSVKGAGNAVVNVITGAGNKDSQVALLDLAKKNGFRLIYDGSDSKNTFLQTVVNGKNIDAAYVSKDGKIVNVIGELREKNVRVYGPNNLPTPAKLGVFSKTESNARYLPIKGKSADSSKLNGLVQNAASTANTLALRDANGALVAKSFRVESPAIVDDEHAAVISYIVGMEAVGAGAKNDIRPLTIAQAREILGIGKMNQDTKDTMDARYLRVKDGSVQTINRDVVFAAKKGVVFGSAAEGASIYGNSVDEKFRDLGGNDWLHITKTDANGASPDSGIVIDWKADKAGVKTSGWIMALHAAGIDTNVTLKEKGKRVWSDNNKPTLTTLGAYPKTGGNLDGDIVFVADHRIRWSRNTDEASIGFDSVSDADVNSALVFRTQDNGNEFFKFTAQSGATVTELFTIKADALRYKGKKVFHESFMPTAAQVGALTKKLGDGYYLAKAGKAASATNADVVVQTNRDWRTNFSGFETGSADKPAGSGFDDFRSWISWGHNGGSKYRHVLSVGTSDITNLYFSSGDSKAGSKAANLPKYKIYHTGAKPTAAELNVYDKAQSDSTFLKLKGGTLSGNIIAAANLYFGTTVGYRYSPYVTDTKDGISTRSEMISSANMLLHADKDGSGATEAMYLRAGGGAANELKILSKNIKDPQNNKALLFNGGVVYHSKNKPTAAEVGAMTKAQGDGYYLNGSTNESVQFSVGGDANTYYPVVIGSFAQNSYAWGHYSISRKYSETAPDTWNTASHKGGLTFGIEWSGDAGHGGNDHNLRVSEFSENYCTMVGGLKLALRDGLVVWLRGGGATYHLTGPGGKANTVSVKLAKWESYKGDVFEPIKYNAAKVTAEVTSRHSVRGTGQVYDSGKRVYSASNKPTAAELNMMDAAYLAGKPLSNADSADVAGVTAYYLSKDATNKPAGTDHSLLTLSFGNTYSTQIAGDWRTNRHYVRGQSEGKWSAWAELYSTLNKPKLSDLGALGVAGGTLTGQLSANKRLRAAGGTTIGGKQVAAASFLVDGTLGIDGNEIYSSQDLIVGTLAANIFLKSKTAMLAQFGLNGLKLSGANKFLDFDNVGGIRVNGVNSVFSNHNNGNITISAASAVGDLYLGYNNGANYQTRNVLLKRPTIAEESITIQAGKGLFLSAPDNKTSSQLRVWDGGAARGKVFEVASPDGSSYGFYIQSGGTEGKIFDINAALTRGTTFVGKYAEGFGYADQFNTKAPFFDQFTTAGTSEYHPLIKQKVKSGAAEYTYSFGTLINSNKFSLHYIDKAGKAATYYWDNGGSFTAPGDVIAYSDKKLKEDIQPIANALEKIDKIGGYTFYRSDLNRRQAGVIAQEMQEVLPEVVSSLETNSHGEIMTVAYGNIVSLLIEGIKELKREIDTLKAI
ncbi:MAG: pyocin knob domain-containing S74 family peptidase [Vibrio splendidus]